MAQQPKKKNVAALSYSSLHEKLGQANRDKHALTGEIKTLTTKYNVKIRQLHDLNIKYTDLRLKHNSANLAYHCVIATSAALNIALLLFTIIY